MGDSSDQRPDRLAVAIFPSRGEAESAVHALLSAGFTASDISLFVQVPIKDEGTKTQASEQGDPIDLGGETGAGLGVAAGGLGGVLAGFGLLAVPGIGPVLAVGPLAAALTGAITGGALGGFAGSLVGGGVSEVEAIAAEHHLRAGRVVVIVQCADRCEAALAILRAKGGVNAA